jgi:glutamate/tyrosine decarboxylase-like PLP-dependent enzyme
MRDTIEQLRKQIQPLELTIGQRTEWRQKVIQHSEAFLERVHQLPVYRPSEDEGRGILASPITEEPAQIEEVLGLLRDHIESSGVTLGVAGHLAFIPPSGLYTAALGDYLAAVTNRYAGLFFAAPGAVRLERMLLRWMADFIGYPATAAGDLTSGGSVANLMGIVTAREAHDLKAQDYSRAVVYLSNQTHHPVAKALRIVGLKECVQRYIPLDTAYRMRPEALEAAIKADKAAGLIPWLIVASAGTIDTGAVDPLMAMAEIARQHHLWFHVDGAYGANFALCPTGKKILRGIELSDSLVLDPHKGLFMPCGSGAVLVRTAETLLNAHYYNADYLQDEDVLASPDEISPAELSPELTRPFRGLRLWLSLKLLGVAPFRAALEEKILLARHFYERIQQVDGFEVGPFPDLSIVTFRYIPKRGDANEFNQQLISAIQHDGQIFLSSTKIGGEVTLRLAVLSLPTHLETIELAISTLRQKASEIEAGKN